MKRRNFLKNSFLTVLGASIVTSKSMAIESQQLKHIDKNSLKFIDFSKNQNYRLAVSNIHNAFFKLNQSDVFYINKKALFPFSFEQGDFAIVLLPLSKNLIQTLLYQNNEKGYVLVGENISNGHSSSMSWPEQGIEVNIQQLG